MVDTQTGFVFNPNRWANHRGLTFRIVPRKNGQGHRVELKGSLHKFHNNGQHNADQFTLNDLLLTLDELVHAYGFNLFDSKINKVEFGVNVELPFPVSQVLDNLVSYKNQPFSRDTSSGTPYYVCNFQRYAVKIYDKGKQKGLACHMLRFEIRADKMEYFNGKGIELYTLADLLNSSNYGLLGALLVDTFKEILFDDPAINNAPLTPTNKEIYRNGRNPRYWQIPDNLTPKQANAHRQRLNRARQRYRSLYEQYGGSWQTEVAALIGETWTRLTLLSDDLRSRIDTHKTEWKFGVGCHKLTEVEPSSDEPISNRSPELTCHELTNIDPPICNKLTDLPTADLSQINPLYSELHCDSNQPANNTVEPVHLLPKPGAVVCLITGLTIESPRLRQRFVSATQLKNLHATDRPTFDRIAARFLTAKQAGATLNQQCYYMAHNIRNTYTNLFNNPLRRLKKYLRRNQRPLLFTLNKAQLTERIQAGIGYREGTRYEVEL
ncbi:hypothetical protein [Spirosoma jeollabukense]